MGHWPGNQLAHGHCCTCGLVPELLAGTLCVLIFSIQFWVPNASFKSIHFAVLICAILLLPVIAYRFFWFDTHPSYADRLQVRRKIYRDDELDREAEAAIKSRSKTAMASKRSFKRRGSLRSGYAFAHTTGFGELIAKGTLFKNLENLRIPSL